MKKFTGLLLIAFLLTSCINHNPIIVIETYLGKIHVELYEDKAPITTKNFMRYIEEKRYLGSTFYRVVKLENQPTSNNKIEVVQGGLYEDNHSQNLPPIEHENTDKTGIKHLDGVISMARYGPGTATFEFFICVGDQPLLDYGGKRNSDNHGFAAFGRVVEGMDVVREIQMQPDSSQYLTPRIPIKSITIVR